METVQDILLFGIWAFFVFVCIYTGVQGLRGKPISLPSKGGGVTGPVRGNVARVMGAFFLILGLFLLVFPFIYKPH